MRTHAKAIAFFATFCLSILSYPVNAADESFRPMPIESWTAVKKRSCVFIHAWAAWCAPCISEMPQLLPVLAKLQAQGVEPIVVDMSEPSLQDGFSRPWTKTLNPAFALFSRPKGNERAYSRAIDPQFPRALPYSVLYHLGEKKQSWRGTVDLARLPAQILQACHLEEPKKPTAAN